MTGEHPLDLRDQIRRAEALNGYHAILAPHGDGDSNHEATRKDGTGTPASHN